MLENLTIVTPIKETKSLLDWYNRMKWLLEKTEWTIIDSGGGKELESLCSQYIAAVDVTFYEARKIGYHHVTSPLTLNLDAFTILPQEYVDEALTLLSSKEADCCAIDYEPSLGHYGYGTSMWRTDILNKLYDYVPKLMRVSNRDSKGEYHILEYSFCECNYMWNTLVTSKHKFVPLFYKAKNNGDPRHGR